MTIDCNITFKFAHLAVSFDDDSTCVDIAYQNGKGSIGLFARELPDLISALQQIHTLYKMGAVPHIAQES